MGVHVSRQNDQLNFDFSESEPVGHIFRKIINQ